MLIPIGTRLFASPNTFFTDFPKQLQKHFSNTTICSLDEIESHIASHNIIMCIRASGMEKQHLYHNKTVIVYYDDLQYWNGTMLQMKLDVFTRADIILTPYYKQFIMMPEYAQFHTKAVWFPFYVPSMLLDFKPPTWQTKQTKALMTGRATPPYPFRKLIIDNPHPSIETLEHPGYFSKYKHDIIGEKYYNYVSSYKGGIVTSATKKGTFEYIRSDYDPHYRQTFNLNYTLAKYFEIPACEVVPFLEHTPDIEELGFKDEENCILITPENYLQKINDNINNSVVAVQARAFVIQHHSFAQRLHVLQKIL